jgi:CDP-glucose 4,6-dehydratase
MADVETVVGQLASHWGRKGDFGPQDGDHPHEAEILVLDSGMARRELGWAPRLSLATAVEWTAEWYRGQLAGKHAADLCLAQIHRYFVTDAIQAAA